LSVVDRSWVCGSSAGIGDLSRSLAPKIGASKRGAIGSALSRSSRSGGRASLEETAIIGCSIGGDPIDRFHLSYAGHACRSSYALANSLEASGPTTSESNPAISYLAWAATSAAESVARSSRAHVCTIFEGDKIANFRLGGQRRHQRAAVESARSRDSDAHV
jgi:hypothetical protein